MFSRLPARGHLRIRGFSRLFQSKTLARSWADRFQDHLLAKVVVAGTDRDHAVRKLATALNATQIWGVETNIEYLRHIVQSFMFTVGAFLNPILDTFGAYFLQDQWTTTHFDLRTDFLRTTPQMPRSSVPPVALLSSSLPQPLSRLLDQLPTTS